MSRNDGKLAYARALTTIAMTKPTYYIPSKGQREWMGLTDEEIQECLQGLPTQTIDVYARRIEAKLKEKNT